MESGSISGLQISTVMGSMVAPHTGMYTNVIITRTGVLHGSSLPSARTAASGKMFVSFSSDGTVEATGFAAAYSAAPKTPELLQTGPQVAARQRQQNERELSGKTLGIDEPAAGLEISGSQLLTSQLP